MTSIVSLHVGLSCKRFAAAGRARIWFGTGHVRLIWIEDSGRLCRKRWKLAGSAIEVAIASIRVAVGTILSVIASSV